MKPRIGALTLMFQLYDALPELEPAMYEFAQELVGILGGFSEVSWPGIIKTREAARDAVRGFEKEERNLIVVVLLTYTPSQVVLRPLLATKLPVLILNTQRLHSVTSNMDPEELIRNHGVHGVQDLANVLRRSDRGFSTVTGHYRDEETLRQVEEWCRAAMAVSMLGRMRVGTLGRPLQGMGDFSLDDTALMSRTGVEVVSLSQRNLAEAAAMAPNEVIEEMMARDAKEFEVAADVSPAEHEESSRLEWAVKDAMTGQRLDALTANFMDLAAEGHLRTLPFLAASRILSEGYGYAGEGDVLTALAVRMMQQLAGSANFTEMFTMDFAGNSLLMSHMGEGNFAMARTDLPVELVGSELGLADTEVRPLLLRFACAPGAATLVNLTVGPSGEFALIASEGEVLDFAPIPGVMTPHYKFGPGRPLGEFLSAMAEAGSSHHFALSYGRWASVIEKIARILGITYAKV
jgi:L-arabinose isomerase